MFDAIIIGAGVAGLACARVLQQQKLSCTVLESSSRVGGRIKTDRIDGFQLDHGFQVLQTGYPDVDQFLNLNALQLQKFPAGVIVRYNGRFHTLADPRHHPRYLLSTLASPICSVGDRISLLRLVRQARRGSFADIFTQPETKTSDYLKNCGFSPKFIESFFRPFFAGACLDNNINASSRVLMYLVRLFATGDAALPAKGMGEIPLQIASSLAPDTVKFNCKVAGISNGAVTLADGTTMHGRQIVVATPESVVKDLLQIQTDTKHGSMGESCLYYSADWTPPFNDPFLLLNGDGRGPVNNIALPSMVAPRYAPAGKKLVAVVVVDDAYRRSAELENEVRNQCREWFGKTVDGWQHLRTYHLDQALPDQSPPTHNPYLLPEPFSEKITICGEYGSLPGLQWALMSGHLTGKHLLAAQRHLGA